MDDARIVSWQIHRVPRGAWRVAYRCSFDRPAVIATAPVLTGDEPFPTLFYLTCPHLTEAVSSLESGGGAAHWRDAVASDARLAERLRAADTAYRRARAAEGGGTDPTPAVGIAGERDVLGMKCLHAHVAAYLAGIGDPVGEGVLAGIDRECSTDRCGEAAW